MAFARTLATSTNDASNDREQVLVLPSRGGRATVVHEMRGRISAVSWQPLPNAANPAGRGYLYRKEQI